MVSAVGGEKTMNIGSQAGAGRCCQFPGRARFLIWMVLAFWTQGWGGSVSGEASTPETASVAKVRVACVGASITFGAGIADRQKNCYPAQMQDLLGEGYDVRNYGVNGRTMLKHGDFPYWNDRAYQQALAFNPDIVVIDLGGNDSKPQNWKYKHRFAADARAMIESFQTLPARPRVLVCLPMPAFKTMWGINDEVITKELTPILRQVAAETGCEVIDLHTPFLGKQAWFADNIHPNAEGAGLMARIIGDAIENRPQLAGIDEAMQAAIAAHEISGAVTVVVTKDKVLHCQTHGLADIASGAPMRPDSRFWIASMTKPVTAVAVMMLQDEGKLNVADPVAKYIAAFADLKTPSGKPANLTLTQILTHTSGLGEAPRDEARDARTLSDLVPLYLAVPMQYEPGAKWQYTQSGINLAARIVEVVSGLSFDTFVQQRILDPLGMKNTTFYPAKGTIVTAYAKNRATGALEPVPPRAGYGVSGHPPLGNGGLYSTGPDYARFCQMLLGGGVLDGKRYLSPAAMKLLTAVQTGALPCGFFQSTNFGNHGANYGWGIGTCVLRKPHEGVAAMLSPGTFGHGGAWGTQAWIDPVRGVAYVLMVQRSNFPNSDASGVRQAFQQAAADTLAK